MNLPLSIGAVVLSLLVPLMASALSLDEAKSAGLVGEKPSGYLGIVVSAPNGEVTTLVQDINARRKSKYAEIAKRNGTAIGAVEALAGKKAIKKTPSGEYVQKPDGSWVKK